MSIRNTCIGVPDQRLLNNCPSTDGCGDQCPDFTIKRHDTKPPFRVAVEDCDGALDLTEDNLVLEVNMWAKAKLKRAITDEDIYINLADNIGFNQAMVGDIIIMERTRLPEHLLVVAFDENDYIIQVQRGYNGTTPSAWKKGTGMRIFRALGASAEIETVRQDITQEDGTILEDQIIQTNLVYQWEEVHTCLPGCFWVEFKLLKMEDGYTPPESTNDETGTPVEVSFTPASYTPSNFSCDIGLGVEWVRRFPSSGEGFLVRISDSPTAELP